MKFRVLTAAALVTVSALGAANAADLSVAPMYKAPPPEVSSEQFYETDDSVAWVNIGELPPDESLHFRYLAAVQTPGIWTSPSEFEPRWEAHVRWTRLRCWAAPLGSM